MKRAGKAILIGFLLTLSLIFLFACLRQANDVEHLGGGATNLGYVKSGVSAHLIISTTTIITAAETYYPITGSFLNDPLENFSFVAGPAIEYGGPAPANFEIDWSATVSADQNGRTIHVAVKKNGVLVDASIMGTHLKVKNEPQALSGTAVVLLEEGDTIQLVATSSVNGDGLCFLHLTTTIREFLNER